MTSVRVQFVLIFAQPIQLYWLSENQNPDKFSYSAAQLLSNALSFYRSQNVLCWSKYFEPAQKFDCIQGLFTNFSAGTKTNFTECKSSFFLVQNVCDCHNMSKKFWSGTKKLDQPKDKALIPFINHDVQMLIWHQDSFNCFDLIMLFAI